MKALELNEEAR